MQKYLSVQVWPRTPYVCFSSSDSRLEFQPLNDSISEMSTLNTLEINNKSDPFSNRKRVRIILLWCRGRDLNPHTLWAPDFESGASAIPPPRQACSR